MSPRPLDPKNLPKSRSRRRKVLTQNYPSRLHLLRLGPPQAIPSKKRKQKWEMFDEAFRLSPDLALANFKTKVLEANSSGEVLLKVLIENYPNALLKYRPSSGGAFYWAFVPPKSRTISEAREQVYNARQQKALGPFKNPIPALSKAIREMADFEGPA